MNLPRTDKAPLSVKAICLFDEFVVEDLALFFNSGLLLLKS